MTADEMREALSDPVRPREPWDLTDELLFGLRRCSVCGRELPASHEFFARVRSRSGEQRLSPDCRSCRRERDRRRCRRRAAPTRAVSRP